MCEIAIAALEMSAVMFVPPGDNEPQPPAPSDPVRSLMRYGAPRGPLERVAAAATTISDFGELVRRFRLRQAPPRFYTWLGGEGVEGVSPAGADYLLADYCSWERERWA